MSDTSPDVAIHTTHILTSFYSAPPFGAPEFTYAYNNYDIAYRDGIPAVMVTFDGMGGSPALQNVSTQQGSSLGNFMPGNPVYPGYVFLGWYTLPNGEGILFDSSTIVNEDITVYAYWEPAPPEPPIPPVPGGGGSGTTTVKIPKTGGSVVIQGAVTLLSIGFAVIISGNKKRI